MSPVKERDDRARDQTLEDLQICINLENGDFIPFEQKTGKALIQRLMPDDWGAPPLASDRARYDRFQIGLMVKEPCQEDSGFHRAWTSLDGAAYDIWLDPLESAHYDTVTFVSADQLRRAVVRRVPVETDLRTLADSQLEEWLRTAL
jgi:hypothetical protein